MISIAAGGPWTRARKFEAGTAGVESDLCPRCHETAETACHRTWACSCNDNGKAFTDTEYIIPRAWAERGSTSCFLG
eukprot:1931846-Pyramimonas_sp.AAC.1